MKVKFIILNQSIIRLNCFLKKIKNQVRYFYKLRIKKSPFYMAHNKWIKDDGDNTLRLDYPLSGGSVVLDLGGYKGDFAEAISERYSCNVYLFEPVLRNFELCSERFKYNQKVRCFNYGLSDADGEFYISDDKDGASLVKGFGNQNMERVVVKEFSSVVESLGVGEIDLLKINIEGGEYSVLQNIISNRLIDRIKYIQVQFHDFVPNANELRDKIRSCLSATHDESWSYHFVWESWKRKY